MVGSKQSFGGPAPFGSAIAPEVMSRSSSFGSTSMNARRAVPNSVSDSHFSHVEVSKESKDDSSKTLSLAEKKLQRLARSRATASVSRSRKREHLHSLQTRLSALEQENKDLVQQIAVRDAELKRFKLERGEPEDRVVVAQPEPAAVQVQASSPREIIVCPATSALPHILCNTAGLPNSTQQQPQACMQAGTSSLGLAGSKHQAATEHAQTLSLQRSRSDSPSADHDASTPTLQVKQEPGQECLTGPTQQHPALGRQSQQQASLNTVTSGEYSHLTIKRQLSIKTAQPVALTQQPEAAPAVDAACPHQAPPFSIFPPGEEGFSPPVSDLHTGSSHSFDSCYLPVGDMPDFDFEADDALMPQEGFWEAGQDAQLPHAQVGSNVQAAPHSEAGSLAGHSRSWDWCSVMAQSLEQPPPCMPDLHPLPQLPPALCTSWEQQAWQASWQLQQQLAPQHQQQRQQFEPSLMQPFELQPTYSKGASTAAAAAAGMDLMDFAGSSDAGAEASWMTLPSCNLEHMLQTDAGFATGAHNHQKAAAGNFQHTAAGDALASS